MRHFRVNLLLSTSQRDLEAELVDEIQDTVDEVEMFYLENADKFPTLAKHIIEESK